MTAPSAVLLILVVLSSCEVVVGDTLSTVIMVVIWDTMSMVVMVRVVDKSFVAVAGGESGDCVTATVFNQVGTNSILYYLT